MLTVCWTVIFVELWYVIHTKHSPTFVFSSTLSLFISRSIASQMYVHRSLIILFVYRASRAHIHFHVPPRTTTTTCTSRRKQSLLGMLKFLVTLWISSIFRDAQQTNIVRRHLATETGNFEDMCQLCTFFPKWLSLLPSNSHEPRKYVIFFFFPHSFITVSSWNRN